jgi:hypothetical protein
MASNMLEIVALSGLAGLATELGGMVVFIELPEGDSAAS